MSFDVKQDLPYTYISYYRGLPVYVGKGNGKRKKHTLCGKSNNELLNEFYFRHKFFGDMLLDTYIVKEHKTDAEALEHEKKLIDKYLPFCNKCSGRYHEDEYPFKQKLEALCDKMGYSQPEVLESKFDFRFLFTPKGLLCRYITLSDNSPFEKANTNYHVRLKKEFYTYFPEYALQYAGIVDLVTVDALEYFHTAVVYAREIEMGVNPFEYLGVNILWAKEAYLCGSFDFVKERAGFFREIEMERFNYNLYKADHHVTSYKEELKRLEKLTKTKEATKRRKERERLTQIPVKKAKGQLQLNPVEKVNRNLTMFPNNEGNRNYLTECGYNLSKCNTKAKYLLLNKTNSVMVSNVKIKGYSFYDVTQGD